MGRLEVIVGGQYGSEGKGAVAGYLARTEQRPLLAIRVGGPNAGHTAYDGKGQKWALRQVPVAAVTNPEAMLCIGAGSEVEWAVLNKEVEELEASGHLIRNRFYIDTQATTIERDHKDREAHLVGRIGSTGKGIGAARADRVMRSARLVSQSHPAVRWTGGRFAPIDQLAAKHLRGGGTVHIEGTQGFGLGLHAGHYPKCTSINCRAIDMLAMAGLSPWASYVDNMKITVVFRPYPIRVAGDSGPLVGETSWEELGLEPEHTTVTKKVRRVGEWDTQLAQFAIAANGGPAPWVVGALTMYDHLYPHLAGKTEFHGEEGTHARHIGDALKTYIELIGTGPQTMVDLR